MSWWRACRLLLTLRCDESSRLMSDAFERDLSRAERWAVRLHFVSCRHCRRLRKQLESIQRLARQRGEATGRLSAESRTRIARALSGDND